MSASRAARHQHPRLKTVVTRFAGTLVAVMSVLLVTSAVADAHMGAPRQQSPRSKLVVSSLPAFEWSSVKRAASYQFEFSAVRNFSSNVNAFGTNPITLDNTAVSTDQTIPNGRYYWRVRGVSASNVPGRWSPIRTLIKRWDAAPKLKTPTAGATVNWPTNPLLFSWAPVPGAVNYQLKIGTSPQMSTLVSGPTNVQGPHYAFPGALAPNTYYWSVTPIDAAGDLGTPSAVHQFTWSWPSQTTLTETDVSPDSTYEEPSFSWTAIPGAASYEVQVATIASYPTNAVILDATGLLSSKYTATQFFPDHTTLYWRVRAVDANGDAGSWNEGQPFTEAFDQQIPSLQNLNVYDENGNAVSPTTPTSDPILRWTPVPGASDYRVTIAYWGGTTLGCEYSTNSATITTTIPAWAPEGDEGPVNNDSWESTEYGWPGSADNSNSRITILANGGFCASIIAVRNDAPLTGSPVESASTLLGSNAQQGFTYEAPTPTSGSLGQPSNSTYSPGISLANAGSAAVGASGTVSTTPMFQWQPIQHAYGYYIVVANAEDFSPNSIVTGGFTQGTTWTPTVELNDQDASYWWEVIPVAADEFGGQPEYNPEDPSAYDPQPFNKSSIPPAPVSPVNGANVPTQPTFSWQSVVSAVNYTLEISADSTFANPIQTITTDNTSYTTNSTLPAGKTLYWRVRANDLSNNLNWSGTQTFTHNLPAPGWQSVPKTGFAIPLLSWSPVSGAIGYNLQITNGGQTTTVPVDTPYMTPAEFFNPGINHLQLQTLFPGNMSSAFSSVATYDRTLPSPGGIHASKHGGRILIRWKTDPLAKAYDIQIATTTGFGNTVASDTTDNSAWVPQISATDTKLRLYWRIAAVDNGGNVGAWHSGVFNGKHAKSKKHGKHRKKHRK